MWTIRPTSTDKIHEFAWGKSKEEDEAFTFSPTPTPTNTNIYIEYVKKEMAQRLKALLNATQATTQAPMNENDKTADKVQFVYKKFNTRKPVFVTKTTKAAPQNQLTLPDVDRYENPDHYIETITQQKKGTHSHTVIKETHLIVDEVERHSDNNKTSENIRKHIELNESETDIEGDGNYEVVTAIDDVPRENEKSTVKTEESLEPKLPGNPWSPVAVSRAAANKVKHHDAAYHPHGKISNSFLQSENQISSCFLVSLGPQKFPTCLQGQYLFLFTCVFFMTNTFSGSGKLLKFL